MAKSSTKPTEAKYTADDNPGTMSLAVKRQQRELELVRDVYGGTLHIRDLRDKHLPQWPKEDDENYEARVSMAVLYPGFKRSVKGLTGLVYLHDPEIGDAIPEAMKTELEDVDMQGRDLATFGREHFEDAECDGHSLIFVDMQAYPEGIKPDDKNAEKALGLRPYWIAIRKGDIRRFAAERIGGRMMLTGIAWKECTVEKSGAFSEQEVTRIREFELVWVPDEQKNLERRVLWRVYEQRKKNDESSWFVAKSGLLGKVMDEIPLSVTYTDYVDLLESCPPLLDAAIECLRHLRKLSDLDNIEHICAVPILGLSGASEDEVGTMTIGAAIGVRFDDPNGKVAWAEILGSGIEQLRKSLDDIERRVATMGLSQLWTENTQLITATSRRIDKSESDSQLSAAARSHQTALNKAAYFHAKWHGLTLPENETWITVNREFESVLLGADVMGAFAMLIREGFPKRPVLEMLQRYGRIPAEADLAQLELEWMVDESLRSRQKEEEEGEPALDIA